MTLARPESASLNIHLGENVQTADQLLARFHFGHRQPESLSGVDLALTLRAAGEQPVSEQWWASGPINCTVTDGVRVSASRDYLVLENHLNADGNLAQIARDCYDRLFRIADDQGFAHFIKFWNHIPAINQGAGDEERYKQFCVGRGLAFDDHHPAGDRIPAATAVGAASDTPLQVIMLAAKNAAQPLENPRQTAAYLYPPQYGVRSPTFARAALAPGGQVFVSGTAAVVGHESRHSDDLEAQVAETLTNWRLLMARAAEISGGSSPQMGQVPGFRIYVRQPGSMERVRQLLRAAGIKDSQAIYLNADICRGELLFEMDGLANCR